MIKKICYTALLMMTLSACGGDGDLPPERAESTLSGSVSETLLPTTAEGVSGRAVDGPVASGVITIYSFINGNKGAMLGSTTTDNTGAFAITFSAATQPLLIELSSGSYVEDASGVVVSLGEGQVLRSLVLYNEGGALATMVTPLTHMAAAFAEYKIANGTTVDDAISQAHATISDVFNFDVTNTISQNVNDASSATSVVSNSYLYGFLLAGISSWTQWVSEQNKAAIHTTYTSMGLSQIIYNDLLLDGVLNGRGYNKAGTAPMDLAFGVVPITADLYRYALPQHMLVMAASNRNQTALTVDNLRSSVLAMTTSNTAIIGGSDSGTNTISLINSEASASACGVHTVTIDFGSAVIVETAGFSIDDNFEGEVQPYASLLKVAIDTGQYAAGPHQLTVSATDVLGQTYDEKFSINLEAALPFVLPPSNRVTNQANASLQGIYCDDGAGIASITVQGQAATLDAGTWEATNVSLSPGLNAILVIVTYNDSSKVESTIPVIRDALPPFITTDHGIARISQGDGTYIPDGLVNINNTALFLETDKLALEGVPITRTDLILNDIPFFGFRVSDDFSNGFGSAPDDLTVRMQYEVNSVVKTPWRELVAIVSGDTYLIPAASDFVLPPDWHQTLPGDVHSLRIQIEDPAGNTAETEFTFKTEFYVPTIAVNNIAGVATSAFNNTAFADRGSLYGAEVDALGYSFTNNTDQAFYIELGDDPLNHTALQEVDEMERVHRVTETMTTEWRAAYINVADPCPVVPSWQAVTAANPIYNFNGFAWLPEVPPQPSSSVTTIETEVAGMITGNWQDIPHFDASFVVGNDGAGNSFTHDYVQGIGITNPERFNSAYIADWRQSNGAVSCDPVYHFQERLIQTRASELGYPRNEFRLLPPTSQPFSTADFFLIDDSTGREILPYLGLSSEQWYRVPAGRSVTAIKRVTTPALPLYNDLDVKENSTTFNSYDPRRLDQKISWSIDWALQVTAAHDAGEANLLVMPTTEGSIDNGTTTYVIRR